MEFLLNLMWLIIAAALSGLLLVSRSRGEAAFGKCIYSRPAAWICCAVLIALLLPAISMTDDRMAMMVPTDGEQIARRYEVSPGGPHSTNIHVLLVPTARSTFQFFLAQLGRLDFVPAPRPIRPPLPRHRAGRAPPSIT